MIVKNKSERRLLQKQRELNAEIAMQAARSCNVIAKYLQRFPTVTRKRIAGAIGIICG